MPPSPFIWEVSTEVDAHSPRHERAQGERPSESPTHRRSRNEVDYYRRRRRYRQVSLQLHGVESEASEIKGLKRARAPCFGHVAHRTPCRMAMEACEGAP